MLCRYTFEIIFFVLGFYSLYWMFRCSEIDAYLFMHNCMLEKYRCTKRIDSSGRKVLDSFFLFTKIRAFILMMSIILSVFMHVWQYVVALSAIMIVFYVVFNWLMLNRFEEMDKKGDKMSDAILDTCLFKMVRGYRRYISISNFVYAVIFLGGFIFLWEN